MSYLMFKHLHVTLVVISVLFFVLRFFWKVSGAAISQKKWVKITPHVVDTLLLLSIAALLHYGLMFDSAWYSQKALGLIGYIAFGILAMRAQTALWRAIGFIGALAWILLLLHLAYAKVPLFG